MTIDTLTALQKKDHARYGHCAAWSPNKCRPCAEKKVPTGLSPVTEALRFDDLQHIVTSLPAYTIVAVEVRSQGLTFLTEGYIRDIGRKGEARRLTSTLSGTEWFLGPEGSWCPSGYSPLEVTKLVVVEWAK